MADTRSLEGTIWNAVYSAFGTRTDTALCDWMAHIGLIYTAVVGTYTFIFPAPYGRYGSKKFGPAINAKIAWMIQESPAFFFPVVLALTTPTLQLSKPANAIAISLFLLHYANRSFIHPLRLSAQSTQTPFLPILAALIFCGYNGFLQGHHLANVYEIKTSLLQQIGGLSLFLFGMGTNIIHDGLLFSLRKSEDSEGRREYSIPRGHLFEYISGANYFGEILEWWGLAIFSGGFPQTAFAIFTSTFLGIRALHHHKWYQEKFREEYPAERKAIIPFIL